MAELSEEDLATVRALAAREQGTTIPELLTLLACSRRAARRALAGLEDVTRTQGGYEDGRRGRLPDVYYLR